jgi:hypothetical protein
MATLREIVAIGDKRKAVIEDACRVLDAEVESKSGFSGIAVKAAYKVVKGISPGFIKYVVNDLLDEFLNAIDPIYQEALEKKLSPRAHLVANPSRVAELLLAVTDGRAAKAKHALIKKTYEKLRSAAKGHVEAAVPRLGQLLETHAPISPA